MALQPRRRNSAAASPAGETLTHLVRCPNLDESNLPAFAERLFQLTESQDSHRLHLDFGGVDYLTGRALGTLLTLHKRLEASGGRLVMYNVSNPVYEVFEATKLHTVLDIRQVGRGAGPSQGWAEAHEGRLARKGKKVCRVLIVEDNPDTALSLKLLLDSQGRQTDIASDGEEALRRMPAFDPDVVVLDLGLPKLDGYHVAAGIRRMNDPSVRIIAVTGQAESEALHRAKAAGVDHFLVKPVDPERLVRLVECTCGRVA